MKKKVLLLLNNAPDVKLFINDLYKRLKEDGFDVIVASESLFYNYTLNLDFSVNYIFSQYFKLNKDKKDLNFLNTSIASFNVWESYFSDFDRANHIGNKHSKDYTNKVIICLHNFFYEIFEKEKIDIVWHEAVSNSFNYVAYNISTLFGAKYKGLIYSRIPKRYDILSSVYGDSEQYKEGYMNALKDNNTLDRKAKEYIDKYLLNFRDIQPDYMKLIGLNATDSMTQLYFRRDKLRYLIKSLLYLIKERKNDMPYAYQLGNPIVSSINTFWMQFKRKIKLPIIIKKYYESIDNSLTDSFFLYPLHYHPESSTSIWAKHYNDELNTITNIAFNLPFGYKLYVKDHISAAGFPPLSFYKKLSQIPNVVIISFHQNTKSLIIKCNKVITLTSTVGFESLVLGKPVIVLGNVFYDSHPLVTKMSHFDELFKILSGSPKEEVQQSQNALATVYGYYNITLSLDDYKDTVDLIVDSIKK